MKFKMMEEIRENPNKKYKWSNDILNHFFPDWIRNAWIYLDDDILLSQLFDVEAKFIIFKIVLMKI